MATLRAGQSTWPGGYPLYFVTSDGGALSFDSVMENLKEVVYSIRHDIRDEWNVVGCDVNYENAELYCSHSGERIESAYADEAAMPDSESNLDNGGNSPE